MEKDKKVIGRLTMNANTPTDKAAWDYYYTNYSQEEGFTAETNVYYFMGTPQPVLEIMDKEENIVEAVTYRFKAERYHPEVIEKVRNLSFPIFTSGDGMFYDGHPDMLIELYCHYMDYADEHFELTPDNMGKEKWAAFLKEIGLEKTKRVDRVFQVESRGETIYVVGKDDIEYDPKDIRWFNIDESNEEYYDEEFVDDEFIDEE